MKVKDKEPRRISSKLKPGYRGGFHNVIQLRPDNMLGAINTDESSTVGSLAVKAAVKEVEGVIGSDNPPRPLGVSDESLLEEWLKLRTPVATIPSKRNPDGTHTRTVDSVHTRKATATGYGPSSVPGVYLKEQAVRKQELSSSVRTRLLVRGVSVDSSVLSQSLKAEQWAFESWEHGLLLKKEMERVLTNPHRMVGNKSNHHVVKAVEPEAVVDTSPPWEVSDNVVEFKKSTPDKPVEAVSFVGPIKPPELSYEAHRRAEFRRHLQLIRIINDRAKLPEGITRKKLRMRKHFAIVQRERLNNRDKWYLYTSAESMVDDGVYQELIADSTTSDKKSPTSVFGHPVLNFPYGMEFVKKHFAGRRERSKSKNKVGSPSTLETMSMPAFLALSESVRSTRGKVADSMSSLDMVHANQNYRWQQYRNKLREYRSKKLKNILLNHNYTCHPEMPYIKGHDSVSGSKWFINPMDHRSFEAAWKMYAIGQKMGHKLRNNQQHDNLAQPVVKPQVSDQSLDRIALQSMKSSEYVSAEARHAKILQCIRNTEFEESSSGILLPKGQLKKQKGILIA